MGIVFDCSYTLDIYEKQKVNIKNLQASRLNGSLFAFLNLHSVKKMQENIIKSRLGVKILNFLAKSLAKMCGVCYNG